MALAGGHADKVGYEYETWWTLYRVVQLLRGEYTAMAVELPGSDGAELWVENRGGRTFDQVKYRSSGSWTPARLRSEGVLRKLKRRYAAGDEILLVLSQPSDEFEKLILHAGTTSSPGELWNREGFRQSLDLLRDDWGASEDETWRYLRQTAVRHDGLLHLRAYVELALETLVVGDPRIALEHLRSLLEETTATTLNAPLVWESLSRRGLMPQPRAEPGPMGVAVRESLSRYVRATSNSSPSLGTVLRREVADVVQAVTEHDSRVVLVVGKAGSGKSVVTSDAAVELSRRGHHVAAIRLDRLDPRTSTAVQLGEAMGFPHSPAIALSDLSTAGMESVLVVDQLDAVSSYSGRMPDVYEAVDEVLHQARLMGGVKVVLVVREIDLAEDPRLRKLAGEDTQTIHVGELTDTEVLDYLARLGEAPPALDSTTLNLLRLPIHLYVFSQLDPLQRGGRYQTLTSLYDAFTRTFRSRLVLGGHADSWPDVSRILIERMNANESLALPRNALGRVPALYIEALVSTNVLIQDAGKMSLFHETYFDYLFAQSFSARGHALVEWFASTGQGLFRRSQLRQLLEYIASTEPDTFADTIASIALSGLRPHLTSIAYSVLGNYMPTRSDWIRLRELASQDNASSTRFVSLLSGETWFSVADGAGDVERLIDQPAWADVLPRVIAPAAATHPARVMEILLARRTRGPIYIQAIRNAFEYSDSNRWIDFAVEQVSSAGLDLPDNPFDPLETTTFHRLAQSRPTAALRLLVASLTQDLNRARAKGDDSLDQAFSRRGRRSLLDSDVARIAQNDSEAFVIAMLPLIENAAADGRSWSYRVWKYRSDSDLIFHCFDEALTQLSRQDSALSCQVVERLADHHIDALDFLVCRALMESSGDRAALWLLESEDHFLIGWTSSVQWESRRLAAHASETCSDELHADLESAILHWNPLYHLTRSDLKNRGLAEIELLSALPTHRMSGAGRQRLAELHRKFPWWEPTEPRGVMGGSVESPIPRAAADKMTDAHWLRAIAKYSTSDIRNYQEGRALGGCDELAQMLGEVAKENPLRFFELAQRIPPSAPAAYACNLLRSLAGLLSQDELKVLIRKARIDHPDESGRAAVSAIEEHLNELSGALLDELISLAHHTDPTREMARVSTSSGYYFDGDLTSAGINSTRGQVAHVLARLIFADRSRLSSVAPALDELMNDSIAAVRCMAAEAALAHAATERAPGLDRIEQLLRDDLVLTSRNGLRALRWAMLWEPDRFAEFMTRAIAADVEDAGAHWANCAVNDALGSAPSDVTTLPETIRVGAAQALAPVPELGANILIALFNDPSSAVRDEASRCLQFLQRLHPDMQDILIRQFLTSDSFIKGAGGLLDGLEEIPGELPVCTWDACLQVIDLIEVDQPSGIHGLAGNLITVLVRLYRAADEAGRERALDLIDRTVLLQLWRAEETLDAVR